MRMLLCELNRIHSHLVYLGTSALELGAISMFWYCFRERETILDLFELVTGQRMHTRYFQAGGLAEDIPRRLLPRGAQVRRVDAARARRLPHAARPQQDLARADEGRRAALGRRRDRARADRAGAARVRRRLGSPPRPAVPRVRPGRLQGAGVHGLRRLRPVSRAHGRDGGVGEDRAPVHRPAGAHGGPAVDRRRPQGRAAAARGAPHVDGVAHPPLQDRHRGLPRPRRRGLRRRSSRRAASAAATSSATAARSRGACTSARRPSPRSRRRRRARTTRSSPTSSRSSARSTRSWGTPTGERARRGHPQIAKQYPESKSAILPALRLAQKQYGWLSREALQEVGEALDLTPAYCMSVASFYDMLHLEPVGTHMIEVCTNVCCGLVNAQAVLEAFELELGVAPGETTQRRRHHPARGRVPRRLLDADARRGRPALSPVGDARRRPRDRRRSCAMPAESPVLVLAGAEERAAPRPRRVPRGRRLRAAREGAGAWSRSRSSQELIESNLRGRGGAFFPTGRKASFIPTPDKIAKPIYITVNADESEPGTFKDREIMLRVPHRLIEGCLIAAHAIQSKFVFIYIRGEYSTRVRRARGGRSSEANAAGLLGGVTIVIHRGAGAYICGEETALLVVARGRARAAALEAAVPGDRGPVRVADAHQQRRDDHDHPEGARDRPGGVRADRRPPDSTGTRVFCLSGNVARPGAYELPHGITTRTSSRTWAAASRTAGR